MAPPVPTRPLGFPLLNTTTQPRIVVELFQDLACPFSKRMCQTLDGVYEAIRKNDPLSSSVEFVFHCVPQPWHPQSPILHECLMALALAVDFDPKPIQTYIQAAYAHFDECTDFYAKDLTRVEIHHRCVTLICQPVLGETVAKAMASKLDFSHLTKEEPNMALGETTKWLKFAIKHHRSRGVHVTPTVFINGIEATDISSSWTCDEWLTKLNSLV